MGSRKFRMTLFSVIEQLTVLENSFGRRAGVCVCVCVCVCKGDKESMSLF